MPSAAPFGAARVLEDCWTTTGGMQRDDLPRVSEQYGNAMRSQQANTRTIGRPCDLGPEGVKHSGEFIDLGGKGLMVLWRPPHDPGIGQPVAQ